VNSGHWLASWHCRRARASDLRVGAFAAAGILWIRERVLLHHDDLRLDALRPIVRVGAHHLTSSISLSPILFVSPRALPRSTSLLFSTSTPTTTAVTIPRVGLRLRPPRAPTSSPSPTPSTSSLRLSVSTGKVGPSIKPPMRPPPATLLPRLRSVPRLAKLPHAASKHLRVQSEHANMPKTALLRRTPRSRAYASLAGSLSGELASLRLSKPLVLRPRPNSTRRTPALARVCFPSLSSFYSSESALHEL